MITVMRVCFFVVSISLMASLVATSLANNSLAKPTEASLSLHQVDQPSSSPCSTSGDPTDGQPNIESSFSDDSISAPLIPNEPPSSTTTTLSTTPSAGTSSTTAGSHNSQSFSSLCPSNSHTSLSLPLESPISSSSTPFHANTNSISLSISNFNSNSMQPQNTLMHDQAPQRRSVTTNQPIPSDHHVIDMEQRANNQLACADLADNNNRPVMLGKTFLGLTFQAALGLMVFRFQGPSSSSSSSSSSYNVHERTLEIVETAMAVGFTGTLIGILLRHAYPLEARYIEYAGAFAASFGFLGITTMFLPDNVNWIVWPAGLLLLAAFILAIFKKRGAGSM